MGALTRTAFLATLLAAFLAPLLALVVQIDGAALTELSESPGFGKSLVATLVTGAGGALLSVAFGAVFAFPFSRYSWRMKRAQRLVLLLPYLVPNFIFAAAYVASWNPTTGLLNGILPLPIGLYGYGGLILLLGLAHLPIAFLMVEDKLQKLDPALREAARMAGAGSFKTSIKVELPLLRPTLLAAFGISFALNASSFAIPAWIGAPERVFPLTYKVYQAMQVGGVDGIPQAAAYSLVLFAITLPLLAMSAWASRNEKRYAVITGKASRVASAGKSGRMLFIGRGLIAIFSLVFIVAPLLVLLATTVTTPGCLQQSGLGCFAEVTLRSYRYVLIDLNETRQAFIGSGLYGGISAVLILILATFALLLFSQKPRVIRYIEAVFALLTATPGAVIALGMIIAFSGKYGINIYNTPWIVVLAYVLKHQNLAFQSLRTGFANLSSSLVEAARLSGANATQAWRLIVLPILRPEVISGFFLALVPILGELTMSIFLASPRFRSIGTVLFDLQDYADQASAAALSVLLLVLILGVNELGRRLSGGRIGY